MTKCACNTKAKPCSHPVGFVHDIDENGTPYGRAVSRWCFKCLDYVSFGPANDAPSILIENCAMTRSPT